VIGPEQETEASLSVNQGNPQPVVANDRIGGGTARFPATRRGKFDPSKSSWVGKTRIDDPELELVWIEFKETGDQVLRNCLIEEYLPLVRYLAERIMTKLPQNIEVADLFSAGIFGLMDAIGGYDFERGVKFETYCTTRIRGAILDSLRANDWVPRSVRSMANRLDRVFRQLETSLGRLPNDIEMAEILEVSEEKFQEMMRDSSAVSILSLSEQVSDDGDSKALRKIDVLEDRRGPLPESKALRSEITEFMMKFLSKKEREIIILYYFEDMTMKEIGRVLELSESRVCQLHSRIVLRLRNQLSKYQGDLLRD